MPWADLTDLRAYYEIGGRGSPTLLIPGLGSTCRVWDPIRRRLGAQLTIITPDNRGSGLSKAKRRPHHLQHYCADLVELLDHLQVERAHVVGLSLGGIIAQRLAVDHPARVDRLVLISCSHRFGPYLLEMMRLIWLTLKHLPIDQFHRSLELLGSGPAAIDLDPQRFERKPGDGWACMDKSVILEQMRCLTASEPREEEFRIAAPTLVIAGEFDALIPHYYAKRMADAIPDSRFDLLRGVGHNPIYECPDRVAGLILRFLIPEASEEAHGWSAVARRVGAA